MEIFTVGHGNRTIAELLKLVKAARIETLLDVRRYPSSRRNPQFNGPILKNSLRSHGINYMWEGEALGGHRKVQETNNHPALGSETMSAYADHMQTETFRESARRALHEAKFAPTVLMCAEIEPTGCHRSLIADFLTLHGIEVYHLVSLEKSIAHELHHDVRMSDRYVIYDRSTQMSLDL